MHVIEREYPEWRRQRDALQKIIKIKLSKLTEAEIAQHTARQLANDEIKSNGNENTVKPFNLFDTDDDSRDDFEFANDLTMTPSPKPPQPNHSSDDAVVSIGIQPEPGTSGVVAHRAPPPPPPPPQQNNGSDSDSDSDSNERESHMQLPVDHPIRLMVKSGQRRLEQRIQEEVTQAIVELPEPDETEDEVQDVVVVVESQSQQPQRRATRSMSGKFICPCLLASILSLVHSPFHPSTHSQCTQLFIFRLFSFVFPILSLSLN